MNGQFRRLARPMFLLLAAATIVAPGASPVSQPAAQAAGTSDGWELRWKPDPRAAGVGAFEALEDDRRGSHPEGLPHIYPKGNTYRFDAHLMDRDGSDRMRNETRGMRVKGRNLEIREGETWRISYQMYVPDTLDATSSFSHIWQLKTSDVGTPVAQLSLPLQDGVQKLQARYWTTDDQVHSIASVDLEPLQNKWISTTIEFKSSDEGYLRWVVQGGRRTVVDTRVDDIDLWFSDEQYNRPKWGIYRSIRSAGLQDTYLLVRNLTAWQRGTATPPVDLPPPDTRPGVYEAERPGNIFEGAAEPAYCRICSGGRKVILIGGNVYDYTVVRGVWSDVSAVRQLTIHAVVDGAQTYSVSVNGANAVEVPMRGTKDVVSTATVSVPLVAGVNTIRFYSHTARSPELDKIVIE
jgi:hypothetical protein